MAFLGDQATYRDPKAVEETLRPLAARIVAERLRVSLTGTTASVGTSDGKALSLRRAEAVKQTLVGLGVDPQTITCTGLGSSGPGHIPDVDAQGHTIPGAAAQNRRVIVDLHRT